jgi:type II secretory pathway component PulK
MVNSLRILRVALIYPLRNLRGNSLSNSKSCHIQQPRITWQVSGSVLFIALWSLCLLTVFAVYLANGVRSKITLIERLNSRDSLHFIAQAGVKQAITELRRQEDAGFDCLNQAWSNNPQVFGEISIGLGKYSVGYNYINQSGKMETRYGLIDEERKLNLNQAELGNIQRLIMIVTGMSETEALTLAASIVDWRDRDNDVSIPSGSAEDSYYQNLSFPYEAKDAQFEVFDELLLVKGMHREVLEKLRNYITIYSNHKININTAPAEVLLALNLGTNLVSQIISFRCGEDGVESTGDDNVFTSLSEITIKLNAFTQLSEQELARLGNLISSGLISVSSSNFMARAAALLGKRELEIICVFNRKGEILSWREG